MTNYLKLMRIKHYIKNFLVIVPLFFAGEIFNVNKLKYAFLGWVSMCLVSSAVYILNDYKDIEKDKMHPTKKNRPMASGKISPRNGLIIMVICIVVSGMISVLLGKWKAMICLLLYLVLNVAYSMGLKNKPIVDVVILASGFVLRIFYGGYVTDVMISQWLYLVVVTGSLYMGLGKRRNELKKLSDTREVLKYYNVPFLDKNMYVCVALSNAFYAFWTLDMGNSNMIWTVPVFIIILMCYSLVAEGDSDGDPVEVILHNKILIALIIVYVMCVFGLIYIFRV